MTTSRPGRSRITNLRYPRSTGTTGRSGTIGWTIAGDRTTRGGTARGGTRTRRDTRGGTGRIDCRRRGASRRAGTTGRSCLRGLLIWTWRAITSTAPTKDTMNEFIRLQGKFRPNFTKNKTCTNVERAALRIL